MTYEEAVKSILPGRYRHFKGNEYGVMARQRRTISLDEKIEQAEGTVLAAKAKYDAALDELKKLVEKRKQLDDKRVLDAYHAGNKSADEIIAFISADDKNCD